MIAILPLVLSGCSEMREPPLEQTFRVEAADLGEPFVTPALELRAPAGWNAAPAESLPQLMTRLRPRGAEPGLRPEAEEPAPRPLALFRSDSTGSFLAVGSYAGRWNRQRADDLASRHRTALEARHPGTPLVESRYRHNRLQTIQFLMSDPGLAQFRLLVRTPEDSLYQVDYVVPRAGYSAATRAIESSMGSITPRP